MGCHFLLQCMKSESEVAQSCPTLRDPVDRSLPGSSVHGISQARVLEWVAIAFSQSKGVAQLCPTLGAPWTIQDSWTIQNSPGQNTGVGSLSLLQGIFPTQELNQGLLHCRRILYQRSYQGSLPSNSCVIWCKLLIYCNLFTFRE